MMYAVVDCDNCFVSCERVFQPELLGKPVVVLSNNDGCVVARSNEAKALGSEVGELQGMRDGNIVIAPIYEKDGCAKQTDGYVRQDSQQKSVFFDVTKYRGKTINISNNFNPGGFKTYAFLTTDKMDYRSKARLCKWCYYCIIFLQYFTNFSARRCGLPNRQ